jgi:hypothetical protein
MQLALNPPVSAACIANGAVLDIRDGSSIDGGTVNAIGYFGTLSGSIYAGSTNGSVTNCLQPTPSSVFGVSEADLRQLADFIVPSAASFPLPSSDCRLYYVNGDATFTFTNKLDARGILFVHGNLTLSEYSNSMFSGLVYVTGDVTIDDGCVLSGCVIALGRLRTSEGASSKTTIMYDKEILAQVNQQVCQYREIKSLHHDFNAIDRR